ncbi:unnamed protein product [Cuscuta europaea]|uniref:Uncharacterized protein n=1 Tax=Cuscuta europaea TaxID=41803 RepID=A0A9P0ZE17_CUSEU|nr:unnamed protein product [Cuscuta europaea]
MASSSKFHPALAVSNIKNFIPITLDLETVEYSSWAELFRITARAYQVLDHLLPATLETDSPPSAATTLEQRLELEAAAVEAKALWDRLDAVVLQWIYGTISHDLLHTIIEPDSTAHMAWSHLADIFQDNKHSRAVYLENQFSNTRLDQFPNVASYCKALKLLADQLSNVGAPVTNSRLVLCLVNGLPEHFDTVASLIQQADPLPLFSKARSMLSLEEARKNQQAGNPLAAAMVHTDRNPPHSPPRPQSLHPRPEPRHNRSRGRGGRQRSTRPPYSAPTPPPGHWPYPPNPWSYWPPHPWSAPPCPYPSNPLPHKQPPSNPSPGILEPRPQAYYSTTGTTPTDIQVAMHTMTLTPPDNNWYMDTGATSHMTSSSGSPHRDTNTVVQ